MIASIQSSKRACPPRHFDYWLFSDIDGTFIGGEPAHQRELRDHLGSLDRRIGLVYCSGRSLQRIMPDIASGLLVQPDAIIGDVGTGLWDAQGNALCEDTHEWIGALWHDGSQRVPEVLAGIPGLAPQAAIGSRRASFIYERHGAAQEAAQAIAPLGYDALISGGCYLDVLPRGVNKGFAVSRVMDMWSLAPDRVMTAGDTLNDLSMLQLPVRSVAVGNADAELRAGLRGAPHVRHAKAEGAGGIVEAMRELGWIS